MSKQEYFKSLLNEWDLILKKKNPYSKIIPCPVCKKNKFNNIFVKKKLNFVKCENCTHVFINPPFKKTIINNHFKNSVTWDYWSKKILINKQQKIIEEKKYVEGIKYIKSLSKKNLQILDIGSASGNFVGIAKKNGWNISAVEPSRYACELLKKKFDCKIYNNYFENLDFENKFDVITCWASLEYSYEPSKFIDKLKKLLNKNGTAIFYISGNSNSLIMKILRENCVGFLFNRMNYFNPRSLGTILQNKFKKKKIVSDVNNIDIVYNYLNYRNPYLKKKFKKELLFHEKKIKSQIMGYKFLAIYEKN
jgi:2-polyprenyl-3-methyl-5-hydroxy-6-metoxy-1,4-benzoquinol methylase